MNLSPSQDKIRMQEYIRSIYKRYPVTPDQDLLLWEQWITIRREEVEKLSKNLEREPAQLAMNDLEKYRDTKEERMVLENAKIEKKPIVRGRVMEQPPRLKQCCYCAPVYEAHRTMEEIGKIRPVDHVCVPQYIRETEKAIMGDPKVYLKTAAEYENYKAKKKGELHEKFQKVFPYGTDLKDLVVIGSKPKKPPPPPPKVPAIMVTEPQTPPKYALRGVYSIKINNTTISKDIEGQSAPHLKSLRKRESNEECCSWTYYFNVPIKKVGRGKLFLQNLGTVTLRYCWKRIKRPIPYLPEETSDSGFYFNKNEDVISPGQIKVLQFTFINNTPGIYNESWEISMCNIFFFDSLGTKLIINLVADAMENFKMKSDNIDRLLKDIDALAIYKIAKSILDDVIEKATTVKPLIYPYKKFFLEAEIFVMKNPICFYHQTEVAKLAEKYTEMTGNKWDLSIATWREAMIAKEFDERIAAYDFLKKSFAILLKPWFEGDALIKEKRSCTKRLLGQLADKLFDEFTNLSKMYGFLDESSQEPTKPDYDLKQCHPVKWATVQNIFYIRVYEHICDTMESIAGILSSLDLNRWIEFDFCRTY